MMRINNDGVPTIGTPKKQIKNKNKKITKDILMLDTYYIRLYHKYVYYTIRICAYIQYLLDTWYISKNLNKAPENGNKINVSQHRREINRYKRFFWEIYLLGPNKIVNNQTLTFHRDMEKMMEYLSSVLVRLRNQIAGMMKENPEMANKFNFTFLDDIVSEMIQVRTSIRNHMNQSFEISEKAIHFSSIMAERAFEKMMKKLRYRNHPEDETSYEIHNLEVVIGWVISLSALIDSVYGDFDVCSPNPEMIENNLISIFEFKSVDGCSIIVNRLNETGTNYYTTTCRTIFDRCFECINFYSNRESQLKLYFPYKDEPIYDKILDMCSLTPEETTSEKIFVQNTGDRKRKHSRKGLIDDYDIKYTRVFMGHVEMPRNINYTSKSLYDEYKSLITSDEISVNENIKYYTDKNHHYAKYHI